MRCTHCRELFPDAAYNELSEALRREFDEHLSTCRACRSQFDEMKNTLSMMSKRLRNDPDEQYLRNFWDRLDPRLAPDSDAPVTPYPQKKILDFRHPVRIPVWAYGIAAMLLIALGIYIGKEGFLARHPVEPLARETQQSVAGDSTMVRTLDYLERSKNLLIGLTNLSEEHRTVLNIDHERKVSRELIDQARVLTVALNRPDKQQLRQLVQDLEIILLQLANIEVGAGKPVIEFVEKGVDRKSILLKINLEEMRAAAGMDRKPSGHQKTNL